MSAQGFTSSGRPPPPKEKYIPLRERTQNNTVPLYDRPEAQPYLMTVESMLEKSTGTLQDSIWAPQNRVKQAAQQRSSVSQGQQPIRQPSGPTHFQKPQQRSGPVPARQQIIQPSSPAQRTSPAVQIESTDLAPWNNRAWGAEIPKSSIIGQGKSSCESQYSQMANPSTGIFASSWVVQPPQTANPIPEEIASTAVMASQQTSIVASNHFRTVPQSYVPSHLRGIEPGDEECARTQAQIVASVAAESSAKLAPTQKAPTFQATDEEAWARKMGLLREPASEKQIPYTKPSSGSKPNTQEQPIPLAMAAKIGTDEEAWARKMGLLPKIPEQTTSLAKRDTEAEEWAQKMGLLREPAQAKQVSDTPQSPASKVPKHGQQLHQISNSGITTPKRAGKAIQNAPFNNPQFHLNQDSNEHFQQYIQGSTITNGKKYTFNNLTPTTQEQHNASVGTKTVKSLSGPDFASQQQRGLPHLQQRGPPRLTGPSQQPMQTKTENNTPLVKNDLNMMFSPSQLASAGANVNKVVAHQKPADSSSAVNGPWPTLQTADVKSFNEKVTHELHATKLVTANSAPLTQYALVTTTGFIPRDHSHKFEDQVSDDGVVEQHAKEGVRATQENNGVDQLLDWDKKRWAPPPCDWENERPAFDDSFVPLYIKEWRANLPCGPSIQVDTTLKQFKGGKCPISNDVLIDPIEQPESMPDVGNGENEMKRLHQTALLDANNYRAREERKQRKAESVKVASDARHRQIAAAVDEPNLFSPKIEIYVRPAQRKDAQDIRKIYNHYVVNSIIPEDQQLISLEDAEALVETAQKEKLPFVVAVKGRVPPSHDVQGRIRSAKIILPQVETVLGFAFAERFNYSFSGTTNGRSRGTVTIQLYVDSTNTRKGVGRNTLDQLLHCMATAYAFKNACPWINPDNDPVHEPNGCGLIHQMIMMVPVLKKDDPNFPWLSKFLYNRFWFKEENRMKSVARSSILHGTGRMLDIAILQCELLHEGEFDAFS